MKGARPFYKARGFRSIAQTDAENEEGEPERVQYEWRKAPGSEAAASS